MKQYQKLNQALKLSFLRGNLDFCSSSNNVKEIQQKKLFSILQRNEDSV